MSITSIVFIITYKISIKYDITEQVILSKCDVNITLCDLMIFEKERERERQREREGGVWDTI